MLSLGVMHFFSSHINTVMQVGIFSVAVALSCICTYCVRLGAWRRGIVDKPDTLRKLHTRPVALLGGVAIFCSLWLIIGFFAVFFPALILVKVTLGKLSSVFIAGVLLILLGIGDEIYALTPRLRFVLTLCIAMIPIVGGIGLDGVTNPFGSGTIGLDKPSFTIPVFHTTFMLGDALVVMWLMGMMYTTKLLDGLDGLSTGITAIGSCMIFFLTQTTRFFQPDVGILALIFTGVCVGFLVFNFKPASIFLGESGSLFLGFFLGILAVISGGKIATTLLVMAVPILDIVRVMIVRKLRQQKISQGDREHLHYRLLDVGFSEKNAVLMLYSVALVFGVTTLFLPSYGKVCALVVLLCGMVLVSILLYRRSSRTL